MTFVLLMAESTPKCNPGYHADFVKVSAKKTAWDVLIQGFPRTVVEFFHDFVNALGGYVLKTAAFGKVMPDQTIGVYVHAAFP